MPRPSSAAFLAAVSALGLSTGCEKQSPIVTMTAGGVVVKAHAIEYCREGETGDECNRSNDVPVLTIEAGDILGIDVPRSVAEQGWAVAEDDPRNVQIEEYSTDHYRAITIPSQIQRREFSLYVVRDRRHGTGYWQFKLRVR